MNRKLQAAVFACVTVLSWSTRASADPRRDVSIDRLRNQIEEAHHIDTDLAELEQQRQRLRADDPRGAALARRHRELLVRGARVKQAAIDLAIAAYGIDASRATAGVSYSAHGDMQEREGVTYLNADGTIRVEIGDLAFASAARLASTIAHEVEIHVNRQLARRLYYPRSDEQGTMIQEVEAYDHEIANRARFGLDDDEIKILNHRRTSYYRRLKWENRNRVDVAMYVKW